MSVIFPSGFRITAAEAVDNRLLLSKAEMLNTIDARMPLRYFCICSDDGKIYVYDKNCLVPSAETGKFSLYSDGTVILSGYYLNGKFYTDSTYTVELEKSMGKLYVDRNTDGQLYTYDGEKDVFQRSMKDASSEISGIMKLYNTHGEHVDGTMTQKSITDGVNAIKFAVDETEPECLVLDLPWD